MSLKNTLLMDLSDHVKKGIKLNSHVPRPEEEEEKGRPGFSRLHMHLIAMEFGGVG